jgi:hypothetical protein
MRAVVATNNSAFMIENMITRAYVGEVFGQKNPENPSLRNSFPLLISQDFGARGSREPKL